MKYFANITVTPTEEGEWLDKKVKKALLTANVLQAGHNSQVCVGVFDLPVEAVVFVSGSTLMHTKLPSKLIDEVWEALAEDAPFSWGDNNRSLVALSLFNSHVQRAPLDIDDEAIKSWLEWLDELAEKNPDLLVDLEN